MPQDPEIVRAYVNAESALSVAAAAGDLDRFRELEPIRRAAVKAYADDLRANGWPVPEGLIPGEN